jgi:hypothetical protein
MNHTIVSSALEKKSGQFFSEHISIDERHSLMFEIENGSTRDSLLCLIQFDQYQFLFAELLLQTSTDPGFSIRRTVSSVIGSISGLTFPDKSSDPFTCSLLIFTSEKEKSISIFDNHENE